MAARWLRYMPAALLVATALAQISLDGLADGSSRAMTSTPAFDVQNRQTNSPLPIMGCAGTYPFANVLLAIAGLY